ncbi:MAG: poly(A) polymerase [Nitrospirae bacterium GWC2_57_13]|jgi:poly(A) polymerase|nr:MAG: poly(A) polymerase [Nitrospirae bacterium GWC2_57_13]OGW41589.1 MAG: poly(A) polymerase [Nitrospirae bacterium GWD2_57_8]HAS54444.1 poly(A) polymerase [Nitrospiraceae bacterium]
MAITPVIIPRSRHHVSRASISRNAVRVLYRLKEAGYRSYLVGGGVRDLLLGREPKDFDIATDATPRDVKKLFRNCRLIGRRFRLAHIHFHDEIIEVATFRSSAMEAPEPEEAAQEVLPVPEALPAPAEGAAEAVAPRPRPPRMLKTEDGMILRDNVFGTPEDDAVRRDFTVNALFYNIADFSVIDYIGGIDDLQRGLIRLIGDPVTRFTEDPVRMVRAVRFTAMLGFTIEEQTERALIEVRDKVALASPSRLYEETLKLFLLGAGEKTYQLLRKYGLFGVLFPHLNDWLGAESDGFPHTRIGKALEWVDACIQAGREVPPTVLFSLILGQYLGEQAGKHQAGGASALPALELAVAGLLSEQSKRVLIPRKIGIAIRDILWNQHRFEKRQGRHPLYFLRRPGFFEAFEYLRFTSEMSGERRDLVAWWQDFIKSHPPGSDGEQAEGTSGRPPDRTPRKRRRKRRPRSKPETKTTT